VNGTKGLGQHPAGGQGSRVDSDRGGFGSGNYSYQDSTDPLISYKSTYVPTQRIELFLANILDEAETLLLKKHKDYGPTNISKSPFGPLQGLLVRMWDKQARAAHLIDNGQDANYESLEDTFMDLLNYSAIAVLVLRKQWPDK